MNRNKPDTNWTNHILEQVYNNRLAAGVDKPTSLNHLSDGQRTICVSHRYGNTFTFTKNQWRRFKNAKPGAPAIGFRQPNGLRVYVIKHPTDGNYLLYAVDRWRVNVLLSQTDVDSLS